MKTLAYKVIFRLDEGNPYEQTYNEGFVIAYINEEGNFVKMEGLLTNDYLIGEIIENDLVITIYSSIMIYCVYSPKDVMQLTDNDKKSLDIFWEGFVNTDELCFPFELNFASEYPVSFNEEYDREDDFEDEDFEDEDDDFEEEDQIQEYGDNLEYVTEKVQLIATEKLDNHEKYIQLLSDFKKANVLNGEEWS